MSKYYERVCMALDADLHSLYEELSIDTGDISIEHKMRWDSLCEQVSTLFEELVKVNLNQESTEPP